MNAARDGGRGPGSAGARPVLPVPRDQDRSPKQWSSSRVTTWSRRLATDVPCGSVVVRVRGLFALLVSVPVRRS